MLSHDQKLIDSYSILRLENTASICEISSSYRFLAFESIDLNESLSSRRSQVYDVKDITGAYRDIINSILEKIDSLPIIELSKMQLDTVAELEVVIGLLAEFAKTNRGRAMFDSQFKKQQIFRTNKHFLEKLNNNICVLLKNEEPADDNPRDIKKSIIMIVMTSVLGCAGMFLGIFFLGPVGGLSLLVVGALLGMACGLGLCSIIDCIFSSKKEAPSIIKEVAPNSEDPNTQVVPRRRAAAGGPSAERIEMVEMTGQPHGLTPPSASSLSPST